MSTPPLDPDDPRLTAYALGEADETDRQAVETFLAESAEGRAAVAQTRTIARVLAEEYAQEHALYLASRPAAESPSNVVPFPSGRRRSWERVAVLTLKAAAMVALAASLVYLTSRRPRRPEVTTLAFEPRSASAPGPMPALDSPGPSSKDKAMATPAEEESASKRASAPEQPRSLTPATPPTGSSAGIAMAIDGEAESAHIPAPAASAGAAGTLSKTEAAAPPSARADFQAFPGTARTAAAAPRPFKPLSPEGQIALTMVRVRTLDGAFFGGVLVSTDGLILAATSLPESSLQPSCTVFLADQRELPATARPAKMGSGWYWLHVNAKGLSATSPAKEFPTNGSPLTVAYLDSQTGATAFSRVPAVETDSSRHGFRLRSEMSSSAVDTVAFAFNAAGELLVIQRSSRESSTTRQTKTRSGLPAAPERIVRPFTDAERALLRQEIERDGRQ